MANLKSMSTLLWQIRPPYLNYSDAVGFLVGDSLPKMLEEYKEKLNEHIHVLPIYPTFLESEFPKLCEDLPTKPLKFIEALIETNTQHVNAYFKFVLSGMINQAWAQFKPLDWRQFNHLMERKQSTANGRKISAHLSNWILPNLSQHLESLLSDADRVNMCLPSHGRWIKRRCFPVLAHFPRMAIDLSIGF